MCMFYMQSYKVLNSVDCHCVCNLSGSIMITSYSGTSDKRPFGDNLNSASWFVLCREVILSSQKVKLYSPRLALFFVEMSIHDYCVHILDGYPSVVPL